MDFSFIIKQMLSLLFIMLTGYIMYRVHVIDDEANTRFSRLVLNISLPAQIITSFLSNEGILAKSEVLKVFLLSVAVYAVYWVVALLFLVLFRVPDTQRGTYLYMIMFGNVGFMGFPVIVAILGEQYLIYAVIFNIVFYLLVFSIGIQFISGGGSQAFNPRLLLNMPLICAFVSIILFSLDIELPDVLMTPLDSLGTLTTPIAMLLLGSTIASMPFKKLFDDWRIYILTGIKLLAMPLLICVLLSRFHVVSPGIAAVMIILSGTPVATNATMLSIQYGGDNELVAKGIFFTTVLSVVTIPLISLLAQ